MPVGTHVTTEEVSEMREKITAFEFWTTEAYKQRPDVPKDIAVLPGHIPIIHKGKEGVAIFHRPKDVMDVSYDKVTKTVKTAPLLLMTGLG